MEVRPGKTSLTGEPTGRGSRVGLRTRARAPRTAILIRLEEAIAHQLKVVAACEGITVQDFCEQAIIPQIQQAMAKHGLSAEQLSR